MSVQPKTMYTIVCDECGKDAFENDESVAWTDEEGAKLALAEDYWWSHRERDGQDRCRDHNPFCESCGEDAGELCGERDFMCPACFAKANA